MYIYLQVIFDKLFEVLDVLPEDIQRDIVQLLPEIIISYDESELAKKLQLVINPFSSLPSLSLTLSLSHPFSFFPIFLSLTSLSLSLSH